MKHFPLPHIDIHSNETVCLQTKKDIYVYIIANNLLLKLLKK